MKKAVVLLFALGSVGCSGPSREQRCFEATRAVAESIEKSAESKGFVSQARAEALVAAQDWKKTECSSLMEKAHRLFSWAKYE